MIKLSKEYPQLLGIRFCNIHKKACSLIVILKPDNSINKFQSTFREFFCVDCKLVLGSDDTYTAFCDVTNERLDA